MPVSELNSTSELQQENLRSHINSLCKIIENHQKIFLNLQNYEAVINDFKSVFELLGYDIPWNIYKNAWTAVVLLKKEKDAIDSEFWFNYSLQYMKLTSELSNLVLSNNFNESEARSTFYEIINNVATDKMVVSNFVKSFDYILNSLLCVDTEIDIDLKENSKLFVCGFGWSGSGAVFDYLREFECVEPINGECPIISEGLVSFKSIVESCNDSSILIKKLVQLFFIVTFISDLSLSPFRGVRNLYKRYKKHPVEYSNCVIELSKVISKIIYNIKNNKPIENYIILLGDKLLNLVAAGLPNGKIVLYNNAIMAKNIDMFRYIQNFHVFCVQRDPRSNYVARVYENLPNILSVNTFINRRIKYYNTFNQKKSLLPQNFLEKNISIINFEDFVLNEKCRLNVLEKSNISINEWKYKKKYFDQNVSIKNLKNFEQFEPQEDIRKISECLNEQLYIFGD